VPAAAADTCRQDPGADLMTRDVAVLAGALASAAALCRPCRIAASLRPRWKVVHNLIASALRPGAPATERRDPTAIPDEVCHHRTAARHGAALAVSKPAPAAERPGLGESSVQHVRQAHAMP